LAKIAFLIAQNIMTKQELINTINPNGVGAAGKLFGLPFDEQTADLIVIPVPWEVTVSYSAGTAIAPEEILYASAQVDLYDADIENAWHLGVAMLPFPEKWLELNETLREEAETYIEWLEDGMPEEIDEEIAYLREIPEIINKETQKLNQWVKETATYWHKQGKMVALLGGDHSTPLGLLQALAEQYQNFGILQIDAHADLREAYEGFEFSHASIMFNALKIPQISKLVQVGIRDYCEAEANIIQHSKGRVKTFFDQDIKEALYEGKTWASLCDEIIAELPDNVYISFDIDGLDPKLCPHTGTPVAGGFEFAEINFLLKKMVKAGKKIISFDLVEVACGEVENEEWDANVGARVLFKLANWMGVSQGKLKMR
jgi:agmatinase